MKKILVLFLFLTVFLVSCGKQPSNDAEEESIQPTITDSEHSDSQSEDEIHPVAEALFSSDSEKFTFDDIIKTISDNNMTAELIGESKTDANISTEDGVYYPVNPNLSENNIRISPLDTFIEILNCCKYIETDSLNEPVIYTFIFHALDINEVKNEICVYVTRSCVKFAYNGISHDKEYANMSENDNYKNVCYGYDFYINGIIPNENGQLATIW